MITDQTLVDVVVADLLPAELAPGERDRLRHAVRTQLEERIAAKLLLLEASGSATWPTVKDMIRDTADEVRDELMTAHEYFVAG